jgi:DNA-binding NarL/FixJ family response regulator
VSPVIRFISVDDHPSISEALGQSAAEVDDLEMVAAFTSIEAIPKPCREPSAMADVVVLDLSLPGVEGLGALETLVGWGWRSVLVFSATVHERIARSALRAGAAGFVAKSVATADVLDAIRTVGRGGQAVLGVEHPESRTSLTSVEEQLLGLLAGETRSSELARLTGVTSPTIDNRISALYDKLGLTGPSRTRARLVAWARENGY